MDHIHFIGIGGVSMSGLAHVMLSRGARVSGSDPQSNPSTMRLEKEGATLYREQVAANIETEKPSLVVVTAAIAPDNPELQAARAAGIPVVSRADFLGRMMGEFRGPSVAVAGTHGKTTTTAMVTAVLVAAGLDPTVLIGGDYAPIGGNVRMGRSECFVTEACEAYDSFLSLAPDVAVVTNVEADHLDHYGTEERVVGAFREFVSRMSCKGVLVWCADDPGARHLVEDLLGPGCPRHRFAYGTSPHEGRSLWASDVTLGEGGSSFRAVRTPDGAGDAVLGTVNLQVPGVHSILNALAAAAVGLSLDVPFPVIARALAAFSGTGRRFEHIGETGGVVVVDDYAHHPTEIAATLKAARESFPDRRVVAVFQPHLYSRTRDFMDGFASSLAAADAVVLADIYPAREKPIPGVRVTELVHRIRLLAPDKTVLFAGGKADVPAALRWVTRPGDLALIMGAGDIREAAEAFAAGAASLQSPVSGAAGPAAAR